MGWRGAGRVKGKDGEDGKREEDGGNYKHMGLRKGRRPTGEAACRKLIDRLFVAGLGGR